MEAEIIKNRGICKGSREKGIIEDRQKGEEREQERKEERRGKGKRGEGRKEEGKEDGESRKRKNRGMRSCSWVRFLSEGTKQKVGENEPMQSNKPVYYYYF